MFLGVNIHAQKLRATISAADFYAQDTTSFFYTVGDKKNVKMVIVDFTTLDADDAVLTLGYGRNDHKAVYAIDITGNPWTLNTSDATLTFTSDYNTVAYTTNAVIVSDIDWRSDYLAFTVIWNSVTSGEIEVWW